VHISPQGDRIAAVVQRSKRGSPRRPSFTLVTADAERRSVLANVPLASPFVAFVLTDGCTDPDRCYCAADPDCDDDGDPCNTASCLGREGCSYSPRPCFECALCWARTATTTTIPVPAGPPPRQCRRLRAPRDPIQ